MIIKGLNCLGLMGTSTFSGVELSLICTDGLDIIERKKSYTVPYPDEMKDKIRGVLGLKRDIPENEQKLQDRSHSGGRYRSGSRCRGRKSFGCRRRQIRFHL